MRENVRIYLYSIYNVYASSANHEEVFNKQKTCNCKAHFNSWRNSTFAMCDVCDVISLNTYNAAYYRYAYAYCTAFGFASGYTEVDM